MKRLLFVLALWLSPAALFAQPAPNLLRNADFQDDWLTLIPQVKNHHWCYSSEFYNRRDFNPDAWDCTGSWQWVNPEAPRGERQMQLLAPNAEVSQRVNWVLVHSSKPMGNLADAGGFPSIVPQRSKAPLKLVRDLTLTVWLDGTDVPAKAGGMELSLCPPSGLTISHPHGAKTKPTLSVTVPWPEGSFASKSVAVKLPAAAWLQAIEAEAAKNPKEKADRMAKGPVLPGTVGVALRYTANQGKVAIRKAELVANGPESPNLLPNGDFSRLTEKAGPNDQAWPAEWDRPAKYRHFPGRLYYLFNTWHNGAFENRGSVGVDRLLTPAAGNSLQMIVPAGDEVSVATAPIELKQKDARLIEVHALVKTDRLAMLNIDAVDENGKRLDSFPFIHMAPNSIGTDGWRLIRQVFKPAQPLQKIRLMLCARGVNGYTLDGTSQQPQNNVVGMVWWSGVQLFEPESSVAELDQRGVKHKFAHKAKAAPVWLEDIDLGERLLGKNVLTATVHSPERRDVSLYWEFVSPSGKRSSTEDSVQFVPAATPQTFRLPYEIQEPCNAYCEYRGTLSVRDGNGKTIASTQLWFSTWSVPISLKLGSVYLRPEQKQFVRLNLGFSQSQMRDLQAVRLEVVRRGSGKVLKKQNVPATPAAIAAQRGKLPDALRDDLTNLVLADVDVSYLPLQPFHDPQRNWILRATAVDKNGKDLATVESAPFCRLAHELIQPAVQAVAIKKGLLHVNGQPWMPWGAVYGHVPVYPGPADSGKYLDLHNLKPWSMYDGFTSAPYRRKLNDFNCLRYVAASITDPKTIERLWKEDNLYASSVYVVPQPVYSVDELVKKAGGKDKLSAYLALCKGAPMIISTAPGIEEAFGLFHQATPEQLHGLEQVVQYLRQATGKPVMVGHGGYWNRLEFEKVPFFDIYDPETEPLYPANLHTDLAPLVKGKNQVVWLRPQMYEDVPYERWRFHVFVELMRGCTGWQIAHGPGDASLFRGLHGELEFFKPIVYSGEVGPKISAEPAVEHWSRRYKGKTYVIAATTRGIGLGHWQWHDEPADAPCKRSRQTTGANPFLSEANSYGADQEVAQGPAIHGLHYLPDARHWPAGTKLVQWVKLDGKHLPKNLVFLGKQDGRWTHSASWGDFKALDWTADAKRAMWFLHSFYRHAYGFLGWDDKLLDKARPYLPLKVAAMGKLPAAGDWVKLELPLDQIGVKGGLVDGVAFAHDNGKVWWGHTSLVTPDGKETVLFGDSLEPAPELLAKTRISVPGLKAGTKVRVLFEDRELTAEDGFFVDDFRGQDLYQRFGGGYGIGYGNGPVALHLYEILGG